MKKIINFRAFNVFKLEKEHWDIDYHNHNFYEIIFIESGKGRHKLNGVSFDFQQGDVFLLTPNDAHEFELAEKTTFIYIKYTEQFLLELLPTSKNSNWQSALKLTLYNKPIINKSIIQSQKDTEHVFTMVKILLHEFTHRGLYSNEMISDIFSCIMTFIARHLNQLTNENSVLFQEGERLEKILSYISIYALDKEKMKIDQLANEFLMSPNYISLYVKKHTGFSIQHHIMQYKLKMAENLLQSSGMNVSEIAEKLGFTDASHFSKAFRQYKGVPPSVLKSRD